MDMLACIMLSINLANGLSTHNAGFNGPLFFSNMDHHDRQMGHSCVLMVRQNRSIVACWGCALGHHSKWMTPHRGYCALQQCLFLQCKYVSVGCHVFVSFSVYGCRASLEKCKYLQYWVGWIWLFKLDSSIFLFKELVLALMFLHFLN